MKTSEARKENPVALFQFAVCRPKNAEGNLLRRTSGPNTMAKNEMMKGLIRKFTSSACSNLGNALRNKMDTSKNGILRGELASFGIYDWVSNGAEFKAAPLAAPHLMRWRHSWSAKPFGACW